MNNRPTSKAITLSIVTLTITAALCLSGCSNQDQSPNEQTTMKEKAGTLRTDQQQDVLDERQTKSDTFLAYKATLTKSEETSERNTNANGSATISLRGDSIHIKGTFSGLNAAYRKSTIHKVLESEKVIELNPTLQNNQQSGTWESSYHFNEDQIAALKADSLYISVYSEAYESSEIKGQVITVDSTNTATDSTQQ